MSKISELSDGGSLVSSDYLIAVRSGGNVKVRMDQINVDQVDLGDNEFIRLGNSQDLTMVHTSTQSIINQAGIGDLLLQKAGATKLTINTSGIDVTGSVTADGLVVGDGHTIGDDNFDNLLIQSSSAEGIRLVDNHATNLLSIESDVGFVSKTLLGTSRFSVDNSTGNVSINGGGSLTFSELTSKIIGPLNQDFIIQQRGNAVTEALRIQNVDNNNLAKFDKNGSVSLYEDTGTTPKFVWDASAESLGIGTTSPASVLDVRGARSDLLRLYSTAPGGNAEIELLTLNNASSVGKLSKITATQVGADTNGSILAFSTSPTTGNTPVERMRVDASGNLLVGTTSTSGGRHFTIGNATAPSQSFQQNGTEKFLFGISGTTNGGVTGSASGDYFARTTGGKMLFSTNDGVNAHAVIDALGNVGIGTSSPAYKLTIGGAFQSVNTDLISITDTATIYRGTPDGTGFEHAKILSGRDASAFTYGSFLSFYTEGKNSGTTDASTERMRIDASGNLLVGTTAAWFNRKVAFVATGGTETLGVVTASAVAIPISVHSEATTGDNEFISFFTEASPVMRGYIDYNRTGNQVRYAVSSDQRLKENIAAAGDAGGTIDSIQVRQFDWKENGTHQEFGLVAQELLEVFPEGVSVKADPDKMMGVDYSKLVPMMLKEIQSLRARVAQLES